MADTNALRQAFSNFLGEDRFRRFVRQGFRKNRLRFWQEQEWERFIAAHPEFAVGMDELAVAMPLSIAQYRTGFRNNAK
jgi:hypothetical protein